MLDIKDERRKMENTKTSITLVAHTNLDEVTEKIKQIELKIKEASSMIEELASEGISVEIEVED